MLFQRRQMQKERECGDNSFTSEKLALESGRKAWRPGRMALWRGHAVSCGDHRVPATAAGAESARPATPLRIRIVVTDLTRENQHESRKLQFQEGVRPCVLALARRNSDRGDQ